MDIRILSALIVIVTVAAVAGVLIFNNMNPKTTGISNPIIGSDNQTTVNNTTDNNNNFTSNTLLALKSYLGRYNGQSNPTPSPTPGPGPTPDPMDHVISLFDAYLKSNYNQSLTPSMAVVIVQNGKILYMKTLGVKDLASGEPVDENTLFGIGSDTKQFSSTNVAQLVSAGLMSWDDKISKYYNSSEFQLYDSSVTGNITIRDCLSMRSGYATGSGEVAAVPFNDSYSKLLYNLRYIGNSTPFNSTFQYFNTLYALPEYCAAKVENTTWNELIKEELLEPLGMTTATTTYTDFINSPNHATPYATINATLKNYEQVMDSFGPAGVMACSISEMVHWLNFQIADTGYYNGVPIVSKSALDETHTGQIELSQVFKNAGYGNMYGFGWGIGDDFITHGGDAQAFHAMVKIYQSKGLGIVILVNGGKYASSFRNDLNSKFKELLYGNETLNPWNPIPLQPEPWAEPPITPAQPLSTYIGVYSNAFYSNINITQVNGSLISYYGNNSCPYELNHWNDNIFVDTTTTMTLQFDDISNSKSQKLVAIGIPDYIANTTDSVFNRTNST